jgi:hypothetical protein
MLGAVSLSVDVLTEAGGSTPAAGEAGQDHIEADHGPDDHQCVDRDVLVFACLDAPLERLGHARASGDVPLTSPTRQPRGSDLPRTYAPGCLRPAPGFLRPAPGFLRPASCARLPDAWEW